MKVLSVLLLLLLLVLMVLFCLVLGRVVCDAVIVVVVGVDVAVTEGVTTMRHH